MLKSLAVLAIFSLSRLALATPLNGLPTSLTKRQNNDTLPDDDALFYDDLSPDEYDDITAANLTVESDSAATSKRSIQLQDGMRWLNWTNGSDTFSIGLVYCSGRWNQRIGSWTYWNGTFDDFATFKTIYRDNCDHAGLTYNYGRQLQNPLYQQTNDASILRNNELSLADFAFYFSKRLCAADGQTVAISGGADGELRKLLALPDNYWTFVFLGTVLTGILNFALYFSAYPHNNAWQKAEAGISASFLVLAGAIVGRFSHSARLAEMDRQIAQLATAGSRRVANRARQAGARVGNTAIQAGQSIATTANTLASASTANLLQLASNSGNGGDSQSNPEVVIEPGQTAVGGGVAIDGSVVTGAGTSSDPMQPGADSSAPGGAFTACLTQADVVEGLGAIQDFPNTEIVSPFETVQEEAQEQQDALQQAEEGHSNYQCPNN